MSSWLPGHVTLVDRVLGRVVDQKHWCASVGNVSSTARTFQVMLLYSQSLEVQMMTLEALQDEVYPLDVND